ncbi:unknown protein [Parachlamydia acanthamoebae UV-7]|uniref:Uncharacterized protein n=1 Tax=Parachlamydia acanthamoebae (strain UV7) TaxID=765952 RepID=F8L0P5_PARAV|nr:unknown protein [Parachlamydia acanthamoebae UV-7]
MRRYFLRENKNKGIWERWGRLDGFRAFDWVGMKEKLHVLTCLASG